ncbi:MAG: hypothetical protein K1X29_03805 [Bdellovibrionales bacterium]|nr:hypothetical protein [Bdellovibrionales bacterium]
MLRFVLNSFAFLISLGLTMGIYAAKGEAESSESVSVKMEIDSNDLKALSEARASQSEEALLKVVRKILSVDEKNLIALNTLAMFYYEQNKYGLSQIILNRALQFYPDSPALHNNMALVLLGMDKQRQALPLFHKALELKGDHKVSAVNLGSLFLQYRDYDHSLEYLKVGYKGFQTELKSGSVGALEATNNYAVALTALGRFNEARDVFQDLVKVNGKNPNILLNFAILLIEKMKNYKEGKKIIAKLKFSEDDSGIQRKIEQLEAKMSGVEN